MNVLLAELNVEADEAVTLTAEQAFELGTDIVNLEADAEKLIADQAATEVAGEQLTALVAIGESTTEEDRASVSKAYAIAAGSIAAKLGVPVEVIGAEPTTEAFDKTKNVIATLANVAHTFIVKLTATAKKLFLKAMAWIVSSDKKRDELVKSLEEKKAHGLTADDYKTLLPVFKTNAAFILGGVDKAEDGSILTGLEADLAEAIKGTENTNTKISKDAFAAKLFTTGSFTDTLSDKVEKVSKESTTIVRILGTAGSKITFIVVGSYKDGEDDIKVCKVVVRELKDVKDETVAAEAKKVYGSVTDVANLVKGLKSAKELQGIINANFDAMKTAVDTADKLRKDAEEWADKREAGIVVKETAIEFSKTAYQESKDAIAKYRFAMALGKAVDGVAKKA